MIELVSTECPVGGVFASKVFSLSVHTSVFLLKIIVSQCKEVIQFLVWKLETYTKYF